MTEFRDQDLRAALNRALRIVGISALIGTPVIWGAWGWPSAVFFLVGGAIAATGILEWRQIMSAVLARLGPVNASGDATGASSAAGTQPKPVGPVVFWFFLRLALAGALLYVSLKSLDGRISALIAGLALAMLALLIEAIRLLRTWSL
ncbi:MAG TPA: hypothetical protein VGM27_03215 [Acidobacteriaceae bacterium]|jgi:hypothetical protein